MTSLPASKDIAACASRSISASQCQDIIKSLDRALGELTATDVNHTQIVEQVGRLIPPTFKPLKHASFPPGTLSPEDLVYRKNINSQVDLLLKEFILSDMILKSNLIHEGGSNSVETFTAALDALGSSLSRLHHANNDTKARIQQKQAHLEALQRESVKARYLKGYWSSLVQSVRRPLRSSHVS